MLYLHFPRSPYFVSLTIMSFNSRHAAQERYLSARYNRRLRRMSRIVETDSGEIVALACRDGSHRSPGKSGKEGARHEARRQVKVASVPVLEPKAGACLIGRRQVEAVMGGMQMGDGGRLTEFIGYGPAAKAYARRTVDECERTMAARIAAATPG